MDDLGKTLISLARAAIAREMGQQADFPATALPQLAQPGATFVTLTRNGQLRGCIGSLEACQPLADDVRANACHAAFRDPRFPPLSAGELASTQVEVSLLTPPCPLAVRDEADALAQLCPGLDGVIFSAQGRRSTFLPQVWEQLPLPADFLARLKQKAGLAADYWGPDVRLERYRVKKWRETAS